MEYHVKNTRRSTELLVLEELNCSQRVNDHGLVRPRLGLADDVNNSVGLNTTGGLILSLRVLFLSPVLSLSTVNGISSSLDRKLTILDRTRQLNSAALLEELGMFK